jgi:hypothetical protein
MSPVQADPQGTEAGSPARAAPSKNPRALHRLPLEAAPTPHKVARQPGVLLDAATRSTMERRFGYDFGHVRVHADEGAAASTQELGARAYALGPHLAFGRGQYAPDTPAGQRLLAHELAHVVQQDTAAPGASASAREPAREADALQTNALETDANCAAEAVSSGRAASVHQRATGVHALRQASSATADPAAAAPKPAKPQREERFNIGRGGHRVDAELDRAVGWLTVKMKCKFNPVNSPLPWPSPARFAQFQADYIRGVTTRWSFKHFLVPETACAGEPQAVSVRVQVIPVTSGEQFTLNVGYTTSFQQSWVGGRTATLDILDVERRSDIPQTPSEHEFGHMLGLPHIHCDRNAPECYGTTSEERADILGEGSFVSPRDYQPFAELMPYFTGCNYGVRRASQIPTSSAPGIGGAIGGLVGGVGLGLAGAAIGGSLFGPVGAVVGGLVGLVGGAIGGFFAGRAIATPRVPS